MGSGNERRIGRVILISLGLTWAVAVFLAVLLFGLPYLIPDCTLGGKTAPLQCGALTPVLGFALEAFLSTGMFLLAATVPWLAFGLLAVLFEALGKKREHEVKP
jgi:hypothetical protein